MSRPPLLRILRRGRGLGGILILLDLVSLQLFLRVLFLFVLEFLEGGHGFLRLFHAMEMAVDDSELIPCLLQNIWIGIGFCRPLEMLSGGSVVAHQHFGATQIVVGVTKAWPDY